MFLRELAVLPTWVLYRTLFRIILRKDHPWRTHPSMSLELWANGAKPLLIEFGLVFWVSGLCCLYVISFLVKELFK